MKLLSCLVAGCLMATAAPAWAQETTTAPAAPGRKLFELRRDYSAATRMAANGDAAARRVAAERLLALYDEIVASDHLDARERKKLRGQVRMRLQMLGSKIERDEAPAETGERPARAERLVARGPNILAQQFGGMPRQQFGGVAQQQMGMRGGLPAQRDAGLDLVELIQSTIAPDSWDVNGGVGTIRYWSPSRALVVTQ